MSLTLSSSLYFNSCLNLTASSPGTKHIISNVTKTDADTKIFFKENLFNIFHPKLFFKEIVLV